MNVTCLKCSDTLWHAHCRHCDYVLTGDPPDGHCPKCGVPWHAPNDARARAPGRIPAAAITIAKPGAPIVPWCQPCQSFHATDAETKMALRCFAESAV